MVANSSTDSIEMHLRNLQAQLLVRGEFQEGGPYQQCRWECMYDSLRLLKKSDEKLLLREHVGKPNQWAEDEPPQLGELSELPLVRPLTLAQELHVREKIAGLHIRDLLVELHEEVLQYQRDILQRVYRGNRPHAQ